MNHPIVSAIVLTYRKFDNLAIVLDSVFHQDYPNIELIISDDGSENFDEFFVQSLFVHKTDNIKKTRIIHHPVNLGTVKNANRAIRASSGEYIFMIGQDDSFFSNRTFSQLVALFSDNLVITGKRMVLKDDTFFELPANLVRQILHGPIRFLYKFLLLNGNVISGSCTYYKRGVFEKYGFFDETMTLVEDYPYYLKLLRNREKIKFVDIITTQYGLGGVSNNCLSSNNVFDEDMMKILEIEFQATHGYLKRILYSLLNYKKCISSFQKTIWCIFNLDILLLRIFYRSKIGMILFGKRYRHNDL